MSFVTRWLTEKLIEEPNRQKAAAIFKDALGTSPTGQGQFAGADVTYDEQGNEVLGNFTYREGQHGGSGLLADIYNPENQARFASRMMTAPGGEVLANAMVNQIQSGGQALDRLQWDADRQDNLVAQARNMLYNAPQAQPAPSIPPANARVPMTPNVGPQARTLPAPNTVSRGQNTPLRNAPIKPKGTAEDYPIYLAQRQKLNNLAMHPTLKDSMKPMIEALDAQWGYGSGAPTAVREWRSAQRLGQFNGSFEDWKKMSRQTIMQQDKPATVGDLNNLMFPPDSPGYAKYGTKIPYGLTSRELFDLGAITRDEIASEGAGKLQMLRTAQEQFPVIEQSIFASPGELDNTRLWEMVGLDFTDLASFFVSPEAQDAYASFEIGMQGITRVETGAAMPPEEIKNTRRRFMPKPWSSNQTNMLRWRAYQHFINNAESIIDPIRATPNMTDEQKGELATQEVNRAITETLNKFGVKNDEMSPPAELKPILAKAKKEGVQYQSHDDDYIYGVDSQGRRTRISR